MHVFVTVIDRLKGKRERWKNLKLDRVQILFGCLALEIDPVEKKTENVDHDFAVILAESDSSWSL